MKHSAEFKAFDALVGKVLSIPRAQFIQREAEYKKQTALNPKRGPKPKHKRVEAPAPVEQPPFLESLSGGYFRLLADQLGISINWE
jgi:hypothetical protein